MTFKKIYKTGRYILLAAFLSLNTFGAFGQGASKVRVADRGDGSYKNPVIHADYSDPDVIRAGDDFYLVASNFNAAPGLPILHSKDLVNWRIVNHVFTAQEPACWMTARPQRPDAFRTLRVHADEPSALPVNITRFYKYNVPNGTQTASTCAGSSFGASRWMMASAIK